MLRSTPRSRLATVAIAAVAATATLPAAAQAAGSTGCPDVPMTDTFAPWGDSAQYLLAPDGGLEKGGSAWSLTRGATVAEGNATFKVGGLADRRSLALPAGSSATTAKMCIGVEHRSMRFFVKRTAAQPKASLNVDVLYLNAAGKASSRRIGRINSGRTWAPSSVLPLIVNRLAPARGNAMQVSLRFTPQGGAFTIDDVYVDPWRRG
ncbi:MAG: hypothetical protein QOI48_710 [Solirubrobacteraceae bacterium]|jgi:hypothetical protein|nr:hypothetical protein [Solirubrobacteraceae bacterium]